MKAKFIDGAITFAPKTIVYNNTKYIHGAPNDVLTALGYKELTYTQAPEVEQGYHAVPHWEEKETTIEQVWEIVEDSPKTNEEIVAELKQKLAETDYQAIKYAEGWISEEEYAPIKAQRQAWRDRINELENGVVGNE